MNGNEKNENLDLIIRFLESHNYHITIFNNPEKGVETVLKGKQVRCDLVILDIFFVIFRNSIEIMAR